MERYRHTKRGTTYRLIGRATVQPGRPYVEGELLRVGRRVLGDLEAIAVEAPVARGWAAIGLGRLQAGAGVFPGDVLAYYRGEADGKFWLRPVAEFFDGRFEYLGLAGTLFWESQREIGDLVEMRARVAFLERRIDDLLEANNRYLLRARAADERATHDRARLAAIAQAVAA